MTLLDSYARFILEKMLRLERGEKLVLTADEGAAVFAKGAAHLAAEITGVDVSLVTIEDGKVAGVDVISPEAGPNDKYKSQAMLRLASFEPSLFEEGAELGAPALAKHRLLADPIDLERRISAPWAVAYVPTTQWAEFVYGPGASVDQLAIDLFEVMGAASSDDLTSTIQTTLAARAEKLMELEPETITLRSPSVDLTARPAKGFLAGTTAAMLRSGRFFYPTLPCEDTILPVDYRSAEGTFKATYPFRLFDKTVTYAEGRIEAGRLVSFDTGESSRAEAYLNSDPLAGFLSEVCLCESLTKAALFKRAFGVPALDRMRCAHLVFGGVTPEVIPGTDSSVLDELGYNTSLSRLEIPVGSKNLEVSVVTKDGRHLDIFADGVFLI